MVKSFCAWRATASAECCVPFTKPGGNPVMEVPGLTPRSPLITDGPVLVTVEPARTAKLPAVPRPTGAVAAAAGPTPTAAIAAIATVRASERVISHKRLGRRRNR